MPDYPAIVRAVWRDDIEMLKRLLRDGGDVIDPDGRSALIAAVIGDKIDIARILIESGSDVSFSDPNGWTPLHFAAQNGSVAMATLLIDAGASIDDVDVHGNTPLWRATFRSRGRGDLIRLLLNHGANPHHPNDSDVSPYSLANTIANYDVAQFYADVAPSTR